MKLSQARGVLEGLIYGAQWDEGTRAEARRIDGHVKQWMEEGGDADILPTFEYSDVGESLGLWGKHVAAAQRLKRDKAAGDRLPFMADRPGEARRFA